MNVTKAQFIFAGIIYLNKMSLGIFYESRTCTLHIFLDPEVVQNALGGNDWM